MLCRKEIGPVLIHRADPFLTTTMQANDTPTQKDIATEHCHDAWCVGIDADGASHFWSSYHETVIVVADADADVFNLDETPFGTLGDWKRHVDTKRGWADCRIGGSLAGDLAEAAR